MGGGGVVVVAFLGPCRILLLVCCSRLLKLIKIKRFIYRERYRGKELQDIQFLCAAGGSLDPPLSSAKGHSFLYFRSFFFILNMEELLVSAVGGLGVVFSHPVLFL